MRELVAIDLPGGPQFVDELQRAWHQGDAVLPIDQRLPATARKAVFEALKPTVVVDHTGRSRFDGQAVEAGDALVVATSGSTGTPKGVVLTHDAVRASALATAARLGTGPSDTWLACLPLSHVGGLSVVTRALATGSSLVVHDGFDSERVRQAAANGATAVSLVPTTYARIDPSMFRVVVLGGSTPPTERAANTHTTYGLTETGSGVVYDGVPLDGVEVQIVDGEILLRGPMMLRCYRNGSSPIDRHGWLHTGDVGHFEAHADGVSRLVVEGRTGDLIITGGENVWPDPVEAVLRTLDSVADVAVASLPDPEWGHRVCAWVVPSDRTSAPTLAQVRDAVTASLPAYCAPKELRLVPSLPRTALGKIQRHLLPGR